MCGRVHPQQLLWRRVSLRLVDAHCTRQGSNMWAADLSGVCQSGVRSLCGIRSPANSDAHSVRIASSRPESRSGRSGLNQPGSCFRHTSEVKSATGVGARPRPAVDSIRNIHDADARTPTPTRRQLSAQGKKRLAAVYISPPPPIYITAGYVQITPLHGLVPQPGRGRATGEVSFPRRSRMQSRSPIEVLGCLLELRRRARPRNPTGKQPGHYDSPHPVGG